MRGEGELTRWRARPPAVVLGDLTLARPLGWQGIPVIAIGTRADDVTFRSRYVARHLVIPGYVGAYEAEAVATLGALGAELVARCGGRVPLFYGSDDQLEMLYRNRAQLAEHYLFTINRDDLAWALHDKGQFLPLCEAVGVRVPRTVVPAGEDDAAAVRAMRTPLLVKPRTKSDWKAIQKAMFLTGAKARVFATAAEILDHPAFPRLRDRLVVQEYIDGGVRDLQSFHGFVADDDRLLAWFSGQKLRTYPAIAGESALLELVRDPDIEAVGRDVVRRLGLRGPFKIDFIRDPKTGVLYTLEVNARFNLWHHLGAAHGVNLPFVAYDYLVSGRVPDADSDYHPRLRWRNFYRDLSAVREQHPVSVARWLASMVVHPTLHEIFAWDDPGPFLSWMRQMAAARRKRQRWLPTA